MNSGAQIPGANAVRILVAEDEPEIREYLQLALWRPNFTIDFAENGEELLTALAQRSEAPALVILDVMMPCKDGISTLREIRRKDPGLPVIMLSGLSSTANIVEAMKSGANNFLIKPVSHEALRQAVDQVLPGPSAAMKTPDLAARMGEPILTGNWNKKLDPLLDRIAASDVPVLLQGETGSGKEVLARRIHEQSLRSDQVFLKLNCAALPSELVESELFGYERGAFTGAFKNNPGKFELANGGTIFLDEIGDMDLKLQAKLLQVLQDHEFLRLGAREPTKVDVRVIAATHRDLETRIEEGTFREDLYYRLNVVNIMIPPLRERRDEILPLASLFLKKHNRPENPIPPITPDLKAALLNHAWPGNVRELENAMRRYLVIRSASLIIDELKTRASRDNRIAVAVPGPANDARQARTADPEPSCPVLIDAGSISVEDQSPLALPAPAPAGRPLDAVPLEMSKVDEARKKAETDIIVQALHSTLWNRKRAAASLGMDYKKFLYKMKRLGIG